MKFIELHLPVEAGKHNMHTDSEELSDSVSFADGRPVDYNWWCVFYFFWAYLATSVSVSVCVREMGR